MRAEHDAELQRVRARLTAAKLASDDAATIRAAKDLLECAAKIVTAEPVRERSTSCKRSSPGRKARLIPAARWYESA